MYPEKIFMGCVAHATDLFLKDIGKTQRKNGGAGPCPGTSAVIQKALMASNVINGSNSVRSALAKVQTDAGKTTSSKCKDCKSK